MANFTEHVQIIISGVYNDYYYDLTEDEYISECKKYESDGYTLGAYRADEACRVYYKTFSEKTKTNIIFEKVGA